MDARRRARERGAEADDPHAEAQLLVERVRAGELPREQVLLLAYAGHPGLAAQLVEDVAEWTAFNEVDAALDLVLGQPVDALSLASWLLGLALFDTGCALRAMATAFPLVSQRVAALEPPPPDPQDPYPEYGQQEFEYETEGALQLINTTLLAFMNWEATGATPVLRGELLRAAEQSAYFSVALPDGFAGFFETPAECARWTPHDLERGEDRRRRRLNLEGWTSLLEALEVDLAAAYRDAQAAVQRHVLSLIR